MKHIDIRKAAVRCYSYIKSLRKVADLFSTAHSTISRWVKCPIPTRKSTRECQITPEMIKVLKTLVHDKPFQSGHEIRRDLNKIFNTNVSLSLCYTALKSAGLSNVKVKTHYRAKLHAERMTTFKNEILQCNVNDLVFIDETGFRTHMFPLRGWVKKGQKLVKYMGTKWYRKSFSSCVAINNEGILHKVHRPRGFDSSSFLQFLQGLELPDNSTLVMDNASIHKTKSVVEFVKSKNWKLCFLPPGMSDFNPIENLFGIVKHYFRKQCLQVVEDSTPIGWIRLIEGVFRQVKPHVFPSMVARGERMWQSVDM